MQLERNAIVAGLLYGLLVFPAFKKPSYGGLHSDAPLKLKVKPDCNLDC